MRKAVAALILILAASSQAATTLTIKPITWDVIGLDSNNVNAGPNLYLVGMRITNTGATTATNVVGTFAWDDGLDLFAGDPYINLQPNSLSTISVASLAAGKSTDFYYNVLITRDPNAYDKIRKYHVTVTQTGGGPVVSPQPRQIYVEHLISQNRNGVDSITGPSTVYVGGTYQYTVVYHTATQGYDQLEAFAGFQNNPFQIVSVQTTYAAPPGATNDSVYADAGGWDPDPTSPSYKSIIGPSNYTGGKAGGGPIVSVYTIKVNSLAPGNNPIVVSNTINDHSGSSYHYNSDFGTGGASITVTVLNGNADLGITKTLLAGSQTATNGNVTYRLTLTNSASSAVTATNIKVSDALPAGLTYVSSTPASGSYDSTSGVWSVASLGIGSSTTLDITASVSRTAGTTITNTATITALDQNDPNPANNSSSLSLGDQVTLNLAKAASGFNGNEGNNVTFTLTLTNTTATPATGVSVTDLLNSTNFQFVSASTSFGSYDSTSGIWNVGTVANGTPATLTLTAKVVNTGTLTNTATITSVNQPNNGTSSANASVVSSYPSANLIQLSTSEPSTSGSNVAVGEIVRFRSEFVLPKGATTGDQFVHALPTGMSYLGNPKVAFVSNLPATGSQFTVKCVQNTDIITGGGAYTAAGGVGGTGSFTNKNVPIKVDGQNLNIGDLVLVINQSDERQNGIYCVINQSGGVNTEWDRAHIGSPTAAQTVGYDTNSQITNGDTVHVTSGTSFGNTNYVLQAVVHPAGANATPSLNVTDLHYSTATSGPISSSTLSGAGLDVSGDETTLSTITPSFAMTTGAPAIGSTGAITFAFGNLTNPDTDANKEFVVLEFNALVTNLAANVAGGVLSNSYQAQITTPASTANSNTVTATVVEPSITGTKTANVSNLTRGATVTYTLTYTMSAANNTSNAYDIVINDPLPSTAPNSLTLIPGSVSWTTSAGVTGVSNTTSGNTLGFTITSMTPGDYIQIVYSATVNNTATVGASIADTSTLTYTSLPGTGTSGGANTTGSTTPGASGAANGERNGAGSSPNLYLVTNAVSLPVSVTADVQISNKVNGFVNVLANLNDTVTVQLTAKNNGPDAASNVVITNLLPTGLTYVTGQTLSPSAGSIGGSGATTTWNIASLASGASATLNIQAMVNSNGSTLVDKATISATEFDPVINNNTAYSSVTPIEAELGVTDTVSPVSPVNNTTVTYTITLVDNGPNNATNVTVSNLLPAGMTFISASSASGTVSSVLNGDGSETTTWTIPAVAVATTATPNIQTLTITATTPASGVFHLTDTATITHSDQYDSVIANNTASVTVPLTPPTAVADAYSVIKNTPLTVSAPAVLSNDTLNSATITSYGKATGSEQTILGLSTATAAGGTVVLYANGDFTYTPATNFTGSDSFKYTLTNAAGSSTATVTLTVVTSLAPPVAVADSYNAILNTPLTVTAAASPFGVLHNDTLNTAVIASYGVNGNEQTSIGLATPTSNAGSVVLNSDGSFTYTPANNFTGTDTFKYTLTNAAGSSTATVTITVVAPPIAVADSYSTSYNTALTVTAAASPFGVLKNDTLNAGVIASYGVNGNEQTTIGSSTATAQGGTIVLNSDGSFTYTPATNFTGSDTFKYTLTNTAGSSTATVTVTVAAPAPAAVADSYSTTVNTALTVAAATSPFGVLKNDTLNTAVIASYGVNGNEQTTIGSSTATAQGGTIVLNSDGSFTYTPATNFSGSDTFKYTLTNAAGSSTATVTITVVAPPVAVADSYSTSYNTALTVTAAASPFGVLKNDTLNAAAIASYGVNGNEQTTIGNSTATAQGGTIVLNSDGSFTYTPANNFTGADTFKYTLTNAAGSSTATVTMTVLPPQPVAVADSYSTTVNTALTVAAATSPFGVVKNDTLNSAVIASYGVNGNEQTTIGSSTATAQGGSIVLNSDGSFTYTPATNFTGSDTFKYTLTNAAGSSTATVTITVVAPPIAVADSYSTNVNTALTVTAAASPFGVLKNDTLNGAAVASYGVNGNEQTTIGSSTATAQGGSIVLNSDGSFTYTPATNFSGSDTFKYTLTNAAGSSTATVTVTVLAPPTAVDDSYTTTINTALTVTANASPFGVLKNDTLNTGAITSYGVNGNEQTTIGNSTATAQAGTIVLNSDGSFTYTPANNFTGTDTFKYTLTNAAGSSTATVTLTVAATLPAPVAVADSYTTSLNTALTVTVATAPFGVLKNDTLNAATIAGYGVNGNEQTTIGNSTATAQGGTIVLNSDGSFTCTPATNFTGADTFKYTLTNATGSSTATVTITVVAPPIAVADSYSTTVNTALTVTAATAPFGVLKNDTLNAAAIASYGVNGNEQTSIGTVTPTAQSGSIVLNSDGSFTYTPATNFTGTDTFKYTLTNAGGSSTATVTLTIVAPPVAVADSYSTNINTVLTVTAAASPFGILKNDTLNAAAIASYGVNGNEQTSIGTATATAQSGSIALNSDGSFTYTPATNFTGSDTFKYTLTSAAGSSTATVTITVTALPVAVADSYSTNLNTALTVTAAASPFGVLKNDTLNAATIASYGVNGNEQTSIGTSTATAQGGSIALNSDGSFTYTPATNFSGSDTFKYTLTNAAGSSTAAVTIMVVAPPVAVADSYTTTINTALTVTAATSPFGVLKNDTLNAAAIASYGVNGNEQTSIGTAIATAQSGSIALNSDGSFTYTPASNFTGTDTFKYTLTNAAGSSTATVTLTVLPQPPVAVADSYSTSYNTPLTVTAAAAPFGVLHNDTLNLAVIASYGVNGNEQTSIGIATATAQGGSIALNSDGSFIYAPATNFTGTDTFKYTLTNAGGSSIATVTLTIAMPKADLGVTISADKTSVYLGQQVTYTIHLVNNGPDDATNVVLMDLLPAGVPFVSSTATQGSYASGTGLWTLGTVPNGGSAVLTITVLWMTPGSQNSTVSVSASDQLDVVIANNSSNISVTGLVAADLAVVKTVNNTNPQIEQQVTYTIQVSNAGPSNATGVQVTDLLPAGLTFVSATPSQGAYAAGTGIWTVGNVNNGAAATLQIVATVETTSTVTNYAQITAVNQFDPNPSNDISSATVIPTIPNLSILKTVDDPTPLPGETVNYTITVTNNGPLDLPELIVLDQLPDGLQFVSATPGQGTYDQTTGLWTAGALKSGATATLLMAATVTNDGSITNVATIVTPSLTLLSTLTGTALPPGVTTSTATTKTGTLMNTSCFGASINLARDGRDKLLFTSSLNLASNFNPNGQAVSFALDGLNYSCVLNQRGQSRISNKLVQLRRDRVSGWIISLRIVNDNLKQIRGIVNETVTDLKSNRVLRVSVGGISFVSKPTTTYSAKANVSGVLSK